MNKLKLLILKLRYKGKDIIHYKESKCHPLLGQRLFNENFGFFTVEKIWNIKSRSKSCEFNYEKNDPEVCWDWKVKIKNDLGYFVVPLLSIILKTTTEKGKGLENSDINYFVFYN